MGAARSRRVAKALPPTTASIKKNHLSKPAASSAPSSTSTSGSNTTPKQMLPQVMWPYEADVAFIKALSVQKFSTNKLGSRIYKNEAWKAVQMAVEAAGPWHAEVETVKKHRGELTRVRPEGDPNGQWKAVMQEKDPEVYLLFLDLCGAGEKEKEKEKGKEKDSVGKLVKEALEKDGDGKKLMAIDEVIVKMVEDHSVVLVEDCDESMAEKLVGAGHLLRHLKSHQDRNGM